jgi:hypothetical protein
VEHLAMPKEEKSADESEVSLPGLRVYHLEKSYFFDFFLIGQLFFPRI